jgi:hypothetical protein
MSDIIDINVTPTIEQVEIVVTENLTTVNINTIQQSGDINAVKLTGNQIVEDVKTFVQSPIVPTATTADQAVNLGQMNLQSVLEGDNESNRGIIISEISGKAVEGISVDENSFFGYSENNVSSVFDIGASNTNNISEFKKGGALKASITHEGKIIGADATEPNQAVMLGQLEESVGNTIPLTGTEVGKPITGDLEFAGNGSAFALKQIPSLGGIKIISFEDDGTILLRVDNGVVLFSLTFSSAGVQIDTNNLTSRGFSSSQNFSSNITDLDYTQKIYVDSALATKLDASAYNDRFKGKFTTLQQLETALPTASTGDYAQVDAGAGSLVRNYNYDLEDGWVY